MTKKELAVPSCQESHHLSKSGFGQKSAKTLVVVGFGRPTRTNLDTADSITKDTPLRLTELLGNSLMGIGAYRQRSVFCIAAITLLA